MQELSFDGMVGSVEASFAAELLTAGVWPLVSEFEDAFLFVCSLGAIETSVSVKRRSAFFFDGGSRPAGKEYAQRKMESWDTISLLTYSKSNPGPAQHPNVYLLT